MHNCLGKGDVPASCHYQKSILLNSLCQMAITNVEQIIICSLTALIFLHGYILSVALLTTFSSRTQVCICKS